MEIIENYDDEEFAIADVDFLSTKPNSHELTIRENVLKKFSKTVLGKWLVADYSKYEQDVTDHTPEETIMGNIPHNQDVEFTKTKDGYLKASCKAVLSKIYAKNLYELFTKDNFRDVSVEMKVDSHKEGMQEIVDKFKIMGVTVLGKRVSGSCPDANMSIVRFSEKEAENFYDKHNKLEKLQKFSEERRREMANEKVYKVNKTELKETPWGDVDKTELRNAVMGDKNKTSLVKDVYALVEDGWEESPSEHLKYPIMEKVGDTFYYNRYGLASALAYAKKENVTTVVSEVEKLYKKFNIDDGKEENMSEIKMEIEGREAWGDVISEVEKHEGKGVYVDSVEKDHIIYTKDKARYRVDADVEVGKDDDKVSAKIKWDTVKKDVDQKMSEKPDEEIEDDEKEEDKEEMSSMLEAEAKRNKELVSKLAETENIIMEKDKELEELRKFKCEAEEMAKSSEVDKCLAEVKECFEDECFEELKKEGMSCEISQLDGWKNKLKALAFESIKTSDKSTNGLWKMASSDVIKNGKKGLWD